MLEKVEERGVRAAAQRAEARVREMEAELKAQLPAGIGCEAEGGTIRVSGRGLGRRYLTDAALRSALARAR
mgnify:CR=1 FL=1